MVTVRWRKLVKATRWKGYAAHVTTGAARAISSQLHPGKRVPGTTANRIDRIRERDEQHDRDGQPAEQVTGVVGIRIDAGLGQGSAW